MATTSRLTPAAGRDRCLRRLFKPGAACPADHRARQQLIAAATNRRGEPHYACGPAEPALRGRAAGTGVRRARPTVPLTNAASAALCILSRPYRKARLPFPGVARHTVPGDSRMSRSITTHASARLRKRRLEGREVALGESRAPPEYRSRRQEFHDAVGFDDQVAAAAARISCTAGRAFTKLACGRAHPIGTARAGSQEAARIGIVRVAFLRYGIGTFGYQATIATCAGDGADAVAELRDLHGGPAPFGQCLDDAGHYRRFADVAGMSADYDQH